MATTPKPGIVKRPTTLAAVPAVPPAETKGEADFIGGAPDAPKATTRRKRGRKEQISLTLKPELIDQVDARAEAMGQSRAAWISAAIYRALQQA